jgi:TctA family transporter
MLETIASGLGLFASFEVVVALALGVLVGTVIGFLPGIGLLVGLSLALPFVVFLEPVVAFAFLLALYAQAGIAGDLTAIAFAVPGTPASAALVIDGHEMAKRGEVGQAMGAALTASAMGAVIGLVPVLLLLPLVRPLVLAMGSPEIFALTLLGVGMISAVSGRSVLKGLASGGIGFLLGTFGPETQFGIIRFGFGNVYLLDGIPLVPLAVSIFAIPEMLDLHGRKASIVRGGAEIKAKWADMAEGMRATVSNFTLVVRCSVIGMIVGFIPGLGATTSQWISYGHAVTFSKEPRNFGHGDIRGVIAPASSNNSKDGGELLPTVAFAVPGSPPMALMLAALILLGVAPGPSMAGANMHLTYFMLFVLVIANISGIGVSALGARGIGRLLSLKGAYLVPVILVFVFVGAGADSGRIGDIIVLLLAGALAWLMRIYGWPVAPLVLAIVLGDRAEQTLWRTISAYGWGWLTRPAVIVLLLLTVLLAATPYLMRRRKRRKDGARVVPLTEPEGITSAGSLAFGAGVALFGVFIIVVPIILEWPPAASVFPVAFGAMTVVLALLVVAFDLRRYLHEPAGPRAGEPAMQAGVTMAVQAGAGAAEPVLLQAAEVRPAVAPTVPTEGEYTDLSDEEVVKRRRLMMLALVGLGLVIWLLGTSLALGLFIAVYLRLEGRTSLAAAAGAAAAVFVACYFGMDGLLGVRLPGGLLTGLQA